MKNLIGIVLLLLVVAIEQRSTLAKTKPIIFIQKYFFEWLGSTLAKTKPIIFMLSRVSIQKHFFEWLGYTLASAPPVIFFVVITLIIPLTCGGTGTVIATAILSGILGFVTLLFRVTSNRKESYSMFGDE